MIVSMYFDKNSLKFLINFQNAYKISFITNLVAYLSLKYRFRLGIKCCTAIECHLRVSYRRLVCNI